jgi:hypothetical protein
MVKRFLNCHLKVRVHTWTYNTEISLKIIICELHLTGP